MTPEQAIAVLDQAASQASLSRQEHLVVQQAVVAIRAFVQAVEEQKEAGKEKAE